MNELPVWNLSNGCTDPLAEQAKIFAETYNRQILFYRSRTHTEREKLKTVILTDGVSKTEAQIIAEAYFALHVGCGAFTGIRDEGARWIVDGLLGYAGMPVRGFYIGKKSGKLVSPIGPSYNDSRRILP